MKENLTTKIKILRSKIEILSDSLDELYDKIIFITMELDTKLDEIEELIEE